MSKFIRIKKGLDLKIKGAVENVASQRPVMTEIAVCPADFPGFIPKIEVEEGENVMAGQALMHHKSDEAIKLVTPVAGIVKVVVRGERRRIERVVIECAKADAFKEFTLPAEAGADECRSFLKETGLWALMRQRPYDIVPDGAAVPRDIFVTGFDSAPLAISQLDFVDDADKAKALEAGVHLLAATTPGRIYVSRRPGSIADIKGAEMIDMTGPHPSGNAGVLIANTSPVNKGETVWTLSIMTLYRIGKTILTGRFMADSPVAITGPEAVNPSVVNFKIGAALSDFITPYIKDDGTHKRIISGNVLTGIKVSTDGYLRYPYSQITIIREGDDIDEFMGWASISPKKMSTNRSFPGHFLFKKLFSPDARLNGSRRALIMSGEYERYMPMDIPSEYLLKAIIGRDIEKMEELGIYEVAPEDFALGEYADTSKLEAQKIVREGLDYLRKELE